VDASGLPTPATTVSLTLVCHGVCLCVADHEDKEAALQAAKTSREAGVQMHPPWKGACARD
jgi:hypothetical protein